MPRPAAQGSGLAGGVQRNLVAIASGEQVRGEIHARAREPAGSRHPGMCNHGLVRRATADVKVFPHRCPEGRSEEHTSELQSLMRISYAVFCLKKKQKTNQHTT